MPLVIKKKDLPDGKEFAVVSSNCSAFGLNGILKKYIKLVDADLRAQTFSLKKGAAFFSHSDFNGIMLKASGRRISLTSIDEERDNTTVYWKSPDNFCDWEKLERPVMLDFSKYKKAFPFGTSIRFYYFPSVNPDQATLELNFHSRNRFVTIEYLFDLKGSDLFCIMG